MIEGLPRLCSNGLPRLCKNGLPKLCAGCALCTEPTPASYAVVMSGLTMCGCLPKSPSSYQADVISGAINGSWLLARASIPPNIHEFGVAGCRWSLETDTIIRRRRWTGTSCSGTLTDTRTGAMRICFGFGDVGGGVIGVVFHAYVQDPVDPDERWDLFYNRDSISGPCQAEYGPYSNQLGSCSYDTRTYAQNGSVTLEAA
jgi:hypothetical protein